MIGIGIWVWSSAAGLGGIGGIPNLAILNDYEDSGVIVNDYEDDGIIINDYEA